jgi:hypothetical protein
MLTQITTLDELTIEWPRVRDWLGAALATGIDPRQLDEILYGIFCREFVLWTAPNTAVVTHLTDVDNEDVCMIFLVGGSSNSAMLNMIEYVDQLAAYAQLNGINRLYAIGRIGWVKQGKKAGFVKREIPRGPKEATHYYKDLN